MIMSQYKQQYPDVKHKKALFFYSLATFIYVFWLYYISILFMIISKRMDDFQEIQIAEIRKRKPFSDA